MTTDRSMLRTPKWGQMSAQRRTAVVVAAIVQFVLAGAAWRDLARRRPDEVRGAKWVWGLVIAINWVGPLAYFAKGRRP